MTKKKINTETARESIIDTINLVGNCVGNTLGPGGNTVLLENAAGRAIITKDGVSVCEAIETDDEETNLIIRIIKEAASRVNKEAGDGTTTTIVLLQALLKEAQKYIAAGYNVSTLKRELQVGKNKIIESLTSQAKQIGANEKTKLSELYDIALISLNGDIEIASLISQAIDEAGEHGLVTIQEHNSRENVLEKVKGIEIKSGWTSPFFCKNRSDKRIVLNNCRILITSHLLKNAAQLTLIEEALKPLIKVQAIDIS